MPRARRAISLAGLALTLAFVSTFAARAEDAPPTKTASNATAPQTPPKDQTKPEGPKSEKQSKEAKLTPIVSNPRDVTRPAYPV